MLDVTEWTAAKYTASSAEALHERLGGTANKAPLNACAVVGQIDKTK